MNPKPAPQFRNVVLTGACGGLGQAFARELIAQGSHIALLGLNRTALNELAALAPERCAVYMLDVSDSAAMQEVAQDWIGHAGLPDLVIANAGVASGFDTAQASDLPVLRRMLEINVLGPATTFQPFCRRCASSLGRLAPSSALPASQAGAACPAMGRIAPAKAR
jgi:NADP-dependent 3-hydroxy acid dehydrogenase YdfG